MGKVAFWIVFLLIANSNAMSQNREVSDLMVDTSAILDLNELVITATRSNRQLASLPLPTVVIDEEYVRQTGNMRLDEMLSELPGILVSTDFGGGQGVQLQGLDSDYTLILINGLPLIGRQAGTLDLNRITVQGIEKIEIVKGPSSALYGSDALAGVINIITRQFENERLNASAGIRAGNLDLINTSFDARSNLGDVRIGLSFDYLSSSGYDLTPESPRTSTVQPYANYTIQPSIAWNVSEQLTLEAYLRRYSQDQDLVQVIDGSDLLGNSEIGETNINFNLKLKPSEQSFHQLEIYHSTYQANEFGTSTSRPEFDFRTSFDQKLFRPEYRWIARVNELHTLTLGTGLGLDRLNATRYEEDITFVAPYAYGQFEFIPGDRWNIISGIRVDLHNQFSNAINPKLALYYSVLPGLSLKSSVGFGYKAPDFRQLYLNFTNSTVGYTVLGHNISIEELDILNENGQINNFLIPTEQLTGDLRSENSMGINIGLEYNPYPALSLSMNAFRNQVDNLIDTRVLAQKTNGQNVFGYYNVGEIISKGVEVSLRAGVTSCLSLTFGYQYLLTADRSVLERIESTGIFGRDPETLQSVRLEDSDYLGLYNRSKHMGQVSLKYTIPDWETYITTRIIMRSGFGLFDTNANAILDRFDQLVSGYSLVNASIGKKFSGPDIELQIAVRNIFDYTSPQYLPNLPGRLFTLQLSKSLTITNNEL